MNIVDAIERINFKDKGYYVSFNIDNEGVWETWIETNSTNKSDIEKEAKKKLEKDLNNNDWYPKNFVLVKIRESN